MATFGSTINPSLGAIDYSPILRGAQSQAQGILAGGQGIAQGISQAGQAIAQGIEKYFKEQEQNKMMTGSTMAMVSADPSLAKDIDPKVLESFANGKVKTKDVVGVYSQVKMAAEMKDIAAKRMQQEQALASYEEAAQTKKSIQLYLSALTKDPSANPYKVISDGGGILNPGVASFIADLEQMKAQTGKLKSETYENTNPKPAPFNANELAYNNMVASWKAANPGKTPPPEILEQFSNSFLPKAQITFGQLPAGAVGRVDSKTGDVTVKQVGPDPVKEEKVKSQKDVSTLIDGMFTDFRGLAGKKAIMDFKGPTGENLGNYIRSSKIGQEFGKALGTEEQGMREKIKASIPVLLQSIVKASGMSAQQVNSEKEMEMILSQIAKPDWDINVVTTQLERLRNKYGHKDSDNARDAIRKEFGLGN